MAVIYDPVTDRKSYDGGLTWVSAYDLALGREVRPNWEDMQELIDKIKQPAFFALLNMPGAE